MLTTARSAIIDLSSGIPVQILTNNQYRVYWQVIANAGVVVYLGDQLLTPLIKWNFQCQNGGMFLLTKGDAGTLVGNELWAWSDVFGSNVGFVTEIIRLPR